MAGSKRENASKVETGTHFKIVSPVLPAPRLAPMIRSHWMIENGLSPVLGLVFKDDNAGPGIELEYLLG